LPDPSGQADVALAGGQSAAALRARLDATAQIAGLRRRRAGAHVEVDIDRQVLLLINDAGNVRVLPVSTGSGKTFVDEDQNSVSYTPRGRFVVYEKHVGWEYGPLGALYFANYISGGVAIHGSKNVPNKPESHGCIRIPVFAAKEVSKVMTLGLIVLVYDKVSFVKNPKSKPSADIE